MTDSDPMGRGAWLATLSASATVGFIVRIAYALGDLRDRDLGYDATIYRFRGAFLTDGLSFQSPDARFYRGVIEEGAIHPPGGGLSLALARTLGFTSVTEQRVWGCILGTITVVVVALVARAVIDRGTGAIAGALAAVSPALWSNDPMLMSETPTQLLTAVTLLLTYRFVRLRTPSAAAWLGASAAATGLVRSEQVLLCALLVAPVILLVDLPRPRRLACLGAAALWAALTLVPWVGWNLVRFEHSVTMASGLDLSLSYAQCDLAWYGDLTGYWSTSCGNDIREAAEDQLADESEVGARYRERAGRYISDHRERLPVVVSARVGRTLGVWKPFQQADLESSDRLRSKAVQRAVLYTTWATYGLAALTFLAGPRLGAPRRRRLLPLLAPLLAGAAGAAITFGNIRYRSAGEVGLTVLAAVALSGLARASISRRPARS